MFAGHILHVYHVLSPGLPLALQPNGDVEHDYIPPEAQLIVGLLQQPETRDFCDRHVIEREPWSIRIYPLVNCGKETSTVKFTATFLTTKFGIAPCHHPSLPQRERQTAALKGCTNHHQIGLKS